MEEFREQSAAAAKKHRPIQLELDANATAVLQARRCSKHFKF